MGLKHFSRSFIIVRTLAFAVLVCCMLCGCSTTIQTYGLIDSSEKRIVIPFPNGGGNGNLEKSLKNAFRQEGWDVLSINVGTDLAVTQTNNISLVTEGGYNPNARYCLHYQYSIADISFTDGYVYRFEITLFDQFSGKDVIDMSGCNTKTPIIRKLRQALKQIEVAR